MPFACSARAVQGTRSWRARRLIAVRRSRAEKPAAMSKMTPTEVSSYLSSTDINAKRGDGAMCQFWARTAESESIWAPMPRCAGSMHTSTLNSKPRARKLKHNPPVKRTSADRSGRA